MVVFGSLVLGWISQSYHVGVRGYKYATRRYTDSVRVARVVFQGGLMVSTAGCDEACGWRSSDLIASSWVEEPIVVSIS